MKAVKKLDKTVMRAGYTYHNIVVDGLIVLHIETTKDLIKAKNTDRIRTKMAIVRYCHYNHENLSKLLDKPIADIRRCFKDYEPTRNITAKDMVEDIEHTLQYL